MCFSVGAKFEIVWCTEQGEAVKMEVDTNATMDIAAIQAAAQERTR